jgi:hypothetical protein
MGTLKSVENDRPPGLPFMRPDRRSHMPHGHSPARSQ